MHTQVLDPVVCSGGGCRGVPHAVIVGKLRPRTKDHYVHGMCEATETALMCIWWRKDDCDWK